MRITFVLNHAGLAGGVRVVAIYARLLQARGHEVVIVSRENRFPRRRDRARDALRRAVRGVTGRREPSHLNGLDVEHRKLPWDCVPRDEHLPDADVVVATWWETAEWVAALSPSKGAGAFFVQHYETHAGQPVERVRDSWRLPLQKIAVSQWLVDLARDKFGDEGAILVPNAVDHEQFHAAPRGKQAAPTVGLMYQPTPYKGCDICLEAFELARRDRPDLRLVGFGSGDPQPHLPLPPGARYTTRPAQERIREIYAACDAWLFGSRSEGFGLPLLEAMACRTPVIATPAGAAPELVAGGGGLLVEPECPRSMAAAILEIARMSDDRWRRMSDAAHATVSGYTWSDATDRFEAALRATIARAARPSAAA